MRFIDEARIRISAGHGGPGCVSFRRETFIPRGGPDGGDGGAGGDVIFIASSQLTTLQDFRFRREYRAEGGQSGSGANKAGRDGEDTIIRVPAGTIIKDADSGELLVDLTVDGQEWVACEGGRGGKGNAHFTTSTHQAPKFAQPGEEGSARELTLELKLLADAAIIGFPNAGKSTLISRISAARPKVADYPFTTLVPHLGVVTLADHRAFVVADIPGLIEGAHRGLGLGHQFLRHIERTRLFIHILDGAPILEDATRPEIENHLALAVDSMVGRYQTLRDELEHFNPSLLHKPELVVVSKMDLLGSDPRLVERIREELRQRIASIRGSSPEWGEPFMISAASGAGIEPLLFAIQTALDTQRSRLGGKGGEQVALPDDEALRNRHSRPSGSRQGFQ